MPGPQHALKLSPSCIKTIQFWLFVLLPATQDALFQCQRSSDVPRPAVPGTKHETVIAEDHKDPIGESNSSEVRRGSGILARPLVAIP